MSAVIMVQLMEWDYAPAESQNRKEHISRVCVAREIQIRTS